ncbi:hypothetical protein G5B46_06790 [Caulobacter sp. 602-2]|uniref:Uncharacterized protein n=1 Tax=Caulobacter sp. 602-2 TaxID=2710887 RepID=A0A6G4QWI9_9CAUL|nr:hypothetical protein [Caulobacter sp. 602-2]NGM49308.1 hypothetical protein [Caulobacter sp. 602-2]
MPERSDAQRRKAAELSPEFAQVRLVEAFEREWEIGFECLHCGARRTWRRDVMLGRARRLLNATMAQIKAKAVCPRCPGRPPAMSFSGLMHPADPERARWRAVEALLEAGINPSDYGYGYQPGRPPWR